MKPRRYSREQWVEWLSEQRSGGLSIAAFCQQKRVSQNSFYLWRRKLAQQISPGRSVSPFVPLAIVGGGQVEIELPCGATIRVPSEESARQILSILLEYGGQP